MIRTGRKGLRPGCVYAAVLQSGTEEEQNIMGKLNTCFILKSKFLMVTKAYWKVCMRNPFGVRLNGKGFLN